MVSIHSEKTNSGTGCGGEKSGMHADRGVGKRGKPRRTLDEQMRMEISALDIYKDMTSDRSS